MRIEYETHNANVGEIQTIYNEALKVFGDIFQDELSTINAISNEALRDAKAVAATAIAGAKALFASCVLAANALPSPADFTAVSKCIGWHAVKMAGIIANYNRSVDRLNDAFKKSYDLIDTEAKLREKEIEDRKELSSSREAERNESQLALIQSDLELCIARVSGN